MISSIGSKFRSFQDFIDAVCDCDDVDVHLRIERLDYYLPVFSLDTFPEYNVGAAVWKNLLCCSIHWDHFCFHSEESMQTTNIDRSRWTRVEADRWQHRPYRKALYAIECWLLQRSREGFDQLECSHIYLGNLRTLDELGTLLGVWSAYIWWHVFEVSETMRWKLSLIFQLWSVTTVQKTGIIRVDAVRYSDL